MNELSQAQERLKAMRRELDKIRSKNRIVGIVCVCAILIFGNVLAAGSVLSLTQDQIAKNNAPVAIMIGGAIGLAIALGVGYWHLTRTKIRMEELVQEGHELKNSTDQAAEKMLDSIIEKQRLMIETLKPPKGSA